MSICVRLLFLTGGLIETSYRVEYRALSLIFSIAHNALTNAFRHSGADHGTISLDFDEEGLCLAVSDDGTGLPEDYGSLGHGFRNMRADAGRMGGVLEVESNGRGTTVSCAVPYERG